MYSMTPLTAEDRATFRLGAVYYVTLLRREDKLDGTVTMKAHVLEEHCPDLMDEYHRLGQFSAQVMEREHAEMKILERRYGNETDFRKRHTNIVSSINRSLAPGVATYEAAVYANSKRMYTPPRKKGEIRKRPTERQVFKKGMT